MKKIFNFLVKLLQKIFKIILIPFNFLLLLFYKISGKIKMRSKSNRQLDLEELAINFFDEYGDKIMFKLELGTNGNNLTIYSSNFKTTLEKAKKRQKDIIEVESNERIA